MLHPNTWSAAIRVLLMIDEGDREANNGRSQPTLVVALNTKSFAHYAHGSRTASLKTFLLSSSQKLASCGVIKGETNPASA